MQLSLVAILDEAGGIGLNNQLLCHLPADLKHFKALTVGKPILMGRKTFASIGRPLPGRKNVVLTHQMSLHPDVVCVSSLENAWTLLSAEPEIMVIGGATLYEQTIHQASRLYITRVHHQFIADTFFPPIDEKNWKITTLGQTGPDERNAYAMTFYLYESLNPKKI